MIYPLILRSLLSRIGLVLVLSTSLTAGVLVPATIEGAVAQNKSARKALTIRADVQQADAATGVVTAIGNVQLNYPARQIQATASQAQYFSRERRIVLSGNVYVLQEGNSLRADSVIYLIDQGRFVARPSGQRQVESIVIVQDGTPISTPQP